MIFGCKSCFFSNMLSANRLLLRWLPTQQAADKLRVQPLYEMEVRLETSADQVSGLNSVEPLYHRVKPNGTTGNSF